MSYTARVCECVFVCMRDGRIKGCTIKCQVEAGLWDVLLSLVAFNVPIDVLFTGDGGDTDRREKHIVCVCVLIHAT